MAVADRPSSAPWHVRTSLTILDQPVTTSDVSKSRETLMAVFDACLVVEAAVVHPSAFFHASLLVEEPGVHPPEVGMIW